MRCWRHARVSRACVHVCGRSRCVSRSCVLSLALCCTVSLPLLCCCVVASPRSLRHSVLVGGTVQGVVLKRRGGERRLARVLGHDRLYLTIPTDVLPLCDLEKALDGILQREVEAAVARLSRDESESSGSDDDGGTHSGAGTVADDDDDDAFDDAASSVAGDVAPRRTRLRSEDLVRASASQPANTTSMVRASPHEVAPKHLPAASAGTWGTVMVLDRRPASPPDLVALWTWQRRRCAKCCEEKSEAQLAVPKRFCHYTELLLCAACMGSGVRVRGRGRCGVALRRRRCGCCCGKCGAAKMSVCVCHTCVVCVCVLLTGD